ncbi:hypothetical protein [Millisia brevis]|uniref:hypothetical protein n=1 Tax=Millisia brevis TaxID=264148 RepID=UPI00082F5908|nr:hypothetical protein [Millisia brevis]
MSERIADSTIVAVLDRAVAGINPVLDTIALRDPFGFKGSTFPVPASAEGADRSRLRAVATALQKAFGKVLDLIELPGTKGWSRLSIDKRASWWVSRIGALNTVAVAFPGIFGIWARRLPLTEVLGLANQAMVLVAVSRELGVTDRAAQVRMLSELLFDRPIDAATAGDTVAIDAADTAATDTAAIDPADAVAHDDPAPGTGVTATGAADPEKRSRSLLRTLWRTGQKLRSLDDELGHRPLPNGFFRFVSNFPVIGAPATYIGERLALGRAAKQARRWIAAHPEVVRPAAD